MDKTLFVLPLEDRFKCQVHQGVLRDPVRASCSHNVCKECARNTHVCPIDGTNLNNAEPKKDMQDDINELLCYCKFGVTTNDDGNLIADPKGCDHIIKYGNKSLHEAKCEFRDADFVMVDKTDETEQEKDTETQTVAQEGDQPGLLPCPNKGDGCFFLAETSDELHSHLSTDCPYERLRALLRQSEARVQLLEREIQLRDEEIADLRSQVGGDSFAKRTVDGGRELLEELVRVFEEELPQGLSNAKEQLQPALLKTSTTISAFKSTVIRKTGDVRRGLSQIHPLEKLADIHPLEKLADMHPIEKIQDAHPIDKLIAILASLKQNIVTAAHGSGDANNNNLIASSELYGEEDEDVKKQIAASLATYEAEKEARMTLELNEAAAIAAAAALSLAEQDKSEEIK